MKEAAARRQGRALDPAKRTAILDGARVVFMRDGFVQGSMDAVAAEAGVGKQTIYRHFRSKEVLVEALVAAMCAPMGTEPSRRPGSFAERVRELLLGFIDGVAGPDSIRLYRAIVAEADRAPELGRLFWDSGPRLVRDAIARAWAEVHEATTGPVVAEQLVHLALGDAYQELVLGTGSPGRQVFERQIDAALALFRLATPPAAAGHDSATRRALRAQQNV